MIRNIVLANCINAGLLLRVWSYAGHCLMVFTMSCLKYCNDINLCLTVENKPSLVLSLTNTVLWKAVKKP